MIVLHQASPAYGTPSLSPFCTKLELYLKLKGLPYRAAGQDMQRAPKGKIPWVELPNGEVMGDSQLILERLEREHPPSLDAWLAPEQRATGRALRRMLEEGTYFCSVHGRWVDEAGWAVTRAAFSAILPAPLGWFLPLIRRRVRQSVWSQGTGRHEPADIHAMAIADLDAVEALFVGPWLFGDRPSTFDCGLFAAIGGMSRFPVDNPVTLHARSLPKLIGFRDRVQAAHFPELPTTR